MNNEIYGEEIHDELMTPGCPQCARKHLESALTYLIMNGHQPGGPCEVETDGLEASPTTLLARALINFDEYVVGYYSHIRLARGFLEQYEMAASLTADNTNARWARNLRCALSRRSGEILEDLELYCLLETRPSISPEVFAWAHVKEALRELPELITHLPNQLSAELVFKMLADVESTYFTQSCSEDPVPPTINKHNQPQGGSHGIQEIHAVRGKGHGQEGDEAH